MNVLAMMQEFEDAALEEEEQKLKNLIFEVFNRLQALQSISIGEFTGFYSLVFYILAIIIAYLLTSTPRTSAARFWLFLILSLNVAAEQMLSQWYGVTGQLDHVDDDHVIQFILIYTVIQLL